MVVFCGVFPKANRLEEAVVVAAVVFPPKLNILGGELGKAALAEVVVVAPPVKLKAGAGAGVGAEVEVPTEVLLETENWKLGGALVAAAVVAPKEKVLDVKEEEEVVEEETEVGAGPNESVLLGGTMAVAVLSGLETPKLKAGTAGAEDDVTTGIGWTLEAVEVVVEEESVGRLNVTVAVLIEMAGLVGSVEEEGEDIVPKEKGEGVVDVTEVSEAVGTDDAGVILSLLSVVLLGAGVGVSVDERGGSPVAAFS